MKKVVLCIPTLGIGGAEKFVVDLATQIDKTAFDVTVAITRINMDSNFKNVLTKNGIRIVDLSGKNYLGMLRKQVAFLKKERPDIVHTNIGSVLHLMLATRLVPVPVKLFTMHNQAEYILGEKKRKKWIYKMAFTLFGYTPVAICDNIAQSIIDAFGLKASKIRKVNNGVDLSRFVPAQKTGKEKIVEIITTGTMYPVKNHSALIDAFSSLHKNYPNTRLTILGSGQMRDELEQKVVQLGLAEVVSMPGIQKNVCAYLQKADIYVSASKTEGLPLSILEAMACGLPIVATDAGGTVDIVKSGVNGIVVPRNNTKALEDALVAMIEDPQLRSTCGAESLRIVQNWSIDRCVQGYEKLYGE